MAKSDHNYPWNIDDIVGGLSSGVSHILKANKLKEEKKLAYRDDGGITC